jgi:hypothetical protein
MDRVEFALRRYRQIMPEPVGTWMEFPARQVQIWLTDDVCPVVEDYCKRPAFRDQATWPLRVLVPGAATPERRLIDAVDEGLVRSAHALVAIASQKRVQRHLLALSPPMERVIENTVEVNGATVQRVSARRSLADDLSVQTRQVESIAQRYWTDLVCANDYFEPCGGWMEQTAPERQAGEFVVCLNPELHAIGDFVTRALLRRVEVLTEVLHACRGMCLQAAHRVGSRAAARIDAEAKAWLGLTADVNAMQKACSTGPDAPLRE